MMKLTMETVGGKTITVEKDKSGFVYLTISGEAEYGCETVEQYARLLPESIYGDEVETLRDLLSAIRN